MDRRTVRPDHVRAVRASIRGRVIVPGDPDYDAARLVFNGGIDRRPGVIVRAADADDVARVVTLARETGIELAVRSGGHSAAGHGTSDGGLVLDLRDMNGVDVDAAGRTAWAGTGITAAAYSEAAGAHGLATGFGDTGSVGVGGITLGGGIGYLVRKYGLTIDDLLAADVVTADGELVRADPTSHPDLFWAIRGGGGNFGVATRFHLRLHALPSIVGGMLLLPATPETVLGFVEAARAAPDELSTICNVMPAPPMPFVPAEQHGKLVILALLAYAGPAEPGERALAPFRALAAPIADLLRPMPYHEIYPPDDPSYRPIAAGRTFFVDTFDRRSADAVFEHLGRSRGAMPVAHIRALGGAMATVPDDATAFAHRRRVHMIATAAIHQRVEDSPAHQAWANAFAAELRRGEKGTYVNFLTDEGEAGIREAYPGRTLDRLRQVKARYDPANLFRSNHNIPPA
ncbi:MAG TPA: FAD-binding oxidoreductase [Candidatus Limnocylindria bacterium]|nr:FAD-binding oxidoreductase [Candidatus Limnocylindria bacterium]